MNKPTLILFILFVAIAFSYGQKDGYLVQFTDKANSKYTLNKPEDFLSQRALERRGRQNIAIVEDDLPVSEYYLDSLRKLKIEVRHTTKWLNGAIVFSSDKELMDTLSNLSFVDYVEMTWQDKSASTIKKFEDENGFLKSTTQDEYGWAWNQVSTINGQLLHERGYKGEDIQIAVIDAGFNSAESLPSFQHLWDNGQILGTKDFVDPGSNIFDEHYHGMKVLSIMGGQISGTFLGTAPEASYWLLRTEDVYSETPIEPDYWICAAEFADSAGVDVINSSLGYYTFDSPFVSYTYENLDGTSRVSRAAEIAASKGMVVVVSAGNEGSNSWHYIGVPADAKDIISVAAMKVDSTRASFSSYGPSYDQRVKPEVTAIGFNTAVQSLDGSIELGNGTSYSSPVIAGMVASLWQALPTYTAKNIVDLIIQNSNQYNNPDDSFGFGIPDFNAAVRTDIIKVDQDHPDWTVLPNPFSDYLVLRSQNGFDNPVEVRVSVYDMVGNRIRSGVYQFKDQVMIKDLGNLANGFYILLLESELGRQHFKLLKK